MPRNAPAIPQQALPPDKRKKEPPPPFENILPSGLDVQWRMPDVFQMVAFDGTLPDPLTASVITLLEEEKSTRPDVDPLKFRYSAQSIRGMYGLAAAMLVEPRLDATQEYGDGNGTLGRREIGFMDITSLYWLFRLGTRRATRPAPDTDQPERTAVAAPAGDGVPPDAGAADGG